MRPSSGASPRPSDASPRDDDFAFFLDQGSERLRRGRAEEARSALERAYELRPDNTKVQNLLGLAYFKLGLLEAAKAIYQRLVRDFPDEAPLQVNLGLVLLRQGRLFESERALRTALELAPEHVRAHCYLGLVLYRRGELAQAREHFVRGDAPEFAEKVDRRLRRGARREAEIRPALLDSIADLAADRLETTGDLHPVTPEEQTPKVDDEGWHVLGGEPPPAAPSSSELPRELLLPASFTGDLSAELPPSLVPMTMPPLPALDAMMLPERLATLPLVDPPAFGLADLAWVPGFTAGPGVGSLARLLAPEAGAFVRPEVVVAVTGAIEWELDGAFARLHGPTRALLAAPRVAATVRGIEVLYVRSSALLGYDASLAAVEVERAGATWTCLRGVGSLLVGAESAPVIVPAEAEAELRVRADLVLAFGPEVETDGPDAFGTIGVRGAGAYVLVAPPRVAG